jgi:hypothetical protein
VAARRKSRARSLARALPAAGWELTLAAGSLGPPGEPTNAGSFFAGLDVHALDYSPALELVEPLVAPVPFQPSYEDRPDAPDRIFAAVDDSAYERLVAAWIELLASAGARTAGLLHLHHLTPANEAAARGFPSLPMLGQLHGTELAMLRRIEAGAPPGWRYARDWERRLRVGAPCGCGAARARRRGPPSGLERAKLRGLSRSNLSASPRPLAGGAARVWRRWLVEQPRTRAAGWGASPIATRSRSLPGRRAGLPLRRSLHGGQAPPLLISAHARAPLYLAGLRRSYSSAAIREGEGHPLATA